MKILHVLQSNHFSGAENVVCQIIGMFKYDTNVEMVYCSRDGQIREALAERDIKFVPIAELSVKELKKVIESENPDVIHAHDMRASFVAARACGKRKLVSHIHNNSFDSRGISAKAIAYLFAGIRAKHIFWVSNSAYEGYYFHKIFQQKSSVLYNIIDIDALYEKMNKDNKSYNYDVTYLGRLSYPKNPQRLMKVFKELTKKKNDVRIAVVGTGEFEDEVKELCMQYGMQGNVTFLGFQSNPLKILHDSKSMIMTSRWEGTPMCALESMALGVPIVSTPVDGLKDIVISGENGYLCELDEDLVENLLTIVSDSQHRDKLSKNAIELSRKINDIMVYKTKILEGYE